MRPNSPECIFLLLGTLEKAGKKVGRLDDELVAGLIGEDEDEDMGKVRGGWVTE
jgi:hypothetical protein